VRELRPESVSWQEWPLLPPPPLRTLLYELLFSEQEGDPSMWVGLSRFRLLWLSNTLAQWRGERYCMEARLLGMTALKAVGRSTVFSMFWSRDTQHQTSVEAIRKDLKYIWIQVLVRV